MQPLVFFSVWGSYEVRLMINDNYTRHKKKTYMASFFELYQNIKIYNSVNGSIPLLIFD
jgi:hypothetical protein